MHTCLMQLLSHKVGYKPSRYYQRRPPPTYISIWRSVHNVVIIEISMKPFTYNVYAYFHNKIAYWPTGHGSLGLVLSLTSVIKITY